MGAPAKLPRATSPGTFATRAPRSSSRQVSGGPATCSISGTPSCASEFAAGPAEGEVREFADFRVTSRPGAGTSAQPAAILRGTTAEPAAIRRLQTQSQTQTQTQSQITTSIGAPAFEVLPQPPVENPPTEDVNSQGRGPATTSRGTSPSFLAYAKSLDQRPSATPARKVRRWARDFFTKYQPHDQGAIRETFGSFVVWTSLERKEAGVGPVARRVDLARALQHGEGEEDPFDPEALTESIGA